MFKRQSFGSKYICVPTDNTNSLKTEGQFLHRSKKSLWYTEKEREDQRFRKQKDRI
jgi:hypothetical protein